MTDKRKDEMPEEIWVERGSFSYIAGEKSGGTRYIRSDLSRPILDAVASTVIHNDEHSVTLTRAASQSLITKALQNALNLSTIEKANFTTSLQSVVATYDNIVAEMKKEIDALKFAEACYFKDIVEKDARIETLSRADLAHPPEEISAGQLSNDIEYFGWHEYKQFGDYLAEKYPHGIKVVK